MGIKAGDAAMPEIFSVFYPFCPSRTGKIKPVFAEANFIREFFTVRNIRKQLVNTSFCGADNRIIRSQIANNALGVRRNAAAAYNHLETPELVYTRHDISYIIKEKFIR